MSVDACAGQVSRGDPDRFAAAMCAQGQARADLLVLFAFNLEVARAPWVTQETMIAEMRLQWWADAIEEIYSGGFVRRHEVVTPLADVVKRGGLEREDFDALIAARRRDIYRDPPEDRADFDGYVRDTAGGLTVLAGAILGVRDDAVSAAGQALGVGNLLRAVPELAARGRKPLPLPGLSQRVLLDGSFDDVAADVVRRLAGGAMDRLAEARRAALPRAVVPAILTGWRGRHVLRVAARDPHSIFGLSAEPILSERVYLARAHLLGRW